MKLSRRQKERLQEDVNIAILNLLQKEQIEVKINSVYLSGKDALSYPYLILMGGKYRRKLK